MKTFLECKIYTKPFNAELISGLLWELSPVGILEEQNHLIVNFDDSMTEQRVFSFLESLQTTGQYESFSFETATYSEKNWNEEWEKNLNIIKVTDKITIKPSSKTYEAGAGEIVITIDPKMSFGTGEHQTTKIMLSFCEKYVTPNTTILDVGTGTGVLAIAAVLLGAKYALGIDNDEWCYENALENIEQNNVKGKVEFQLAEITAIQAKLFDVVLANIQKDVLLTIANALYSITRNGGLLILSGLLSTDEEDIVKTYTNLGMNFIDKIQLDEWIGLVLQK